MKAPAVIDAILQPEINLSSGIESIEVNNIDDAKYNVDNAAIPVKAPDAIDAMPMFPPRSLTMAA